MTNNPDIIFSRDKLKLFFLLLALVSFSQKMFALGETNFVQDVSALGSFALFDKNPAAILMDTNDWPGVIRAADDLAADINRVTRKSPPILNTPKLAGKNAVIIGTVGKSKFIDRLIREKKIDVSDISNQWESFFVQVVPKPLPGIQNALVICGSDKRGTIYGIYDLSEQIGVSPWYFWADVPVKHHDKLFVLAGKFVQGPPSVKYRGIFLNDEAPDLTDWVREKFGTVPGMPGVANYGRGFYTNLFELILRLRGNYLWPAMWNNAFNEDDPENPQLADEYGIVMGTSHQEPMMRAQKEWDRKYSREYGSWNYARIPNVVSNFWRDGIERNKDYENLITIGLRGANDTPMADGGPEANMTLLERIVADQRKIIADVINPDVTKVPQVWCLYKEVMDYYNAGMRVPDDVTLLWAEDNWGNVRRLPTAEERQRSGGAGVYYHFDYHGDPRNYQWINTDPIPKIWDQMSLAKQYRADRIWVVNVGHFKGYEFPMEFFMHLAWDTSRWTNENLDEYTRLWAQREFGPEHADEIAEIISTYTKYNGRRKPELLDANTYSLVNYSEFENVVADYNSLADRAEKIYEQLPPESRDAFYELVLFPTKACAQLNAMYLAAAKNNLYAKQGRASANDFAVQTRDLFVVETNLMNFFNTQFAGGKWNHFMDQPFIGYTNWNEPTRNNLDAVPLTEIEVPDAAAMGVAVENSETAATNGDISLPQLDVFNQQRRYIDVFNKGKIPFDFTATAGAPWIVLSETAGTIEKEKRLWIGVDWSETPKGASTGEIKISGAGGEVTVNVETFYPSEPTRESLQGFVEGDGCVSIEAEHFTKNLDSGANRWIKIPNYGHTLSAMRADAPADAQATLGKDSPCLEYKMYLFSTGKVDVVSTVGPTLNFLHGRPLRYAVSFDDEAPQTVTIVPANFNAQNGNLDWEESVKNNCRNVESSHTLATPGYHTLKIWMIDPAVAVEKIVVNTGGVKPSYLGPPESFHQ
jgi:Glycosyl hydrolase family 115/Gylcosyl hydrolase family 115 C-terminal domain